MAISDPHSSEETETPASADKPPRRTGPLERALARWSPGVALLVLLVAVPLSLWHVERRAVDIIEKTLSRAFGRPVRVGALLASPSQRRLVLDDIRMGALLRIQRVELGVDNWTRPRFAELRLVRPTLRLDTPAGRELLEQWFAPAARARAAGETTGSSGSGLRQRVRVRVIDGRLVAAAAVAAHRYAFDARGVFVDLNRPPGSRASGKLAAQAHTHVVLGETRLTRDGALVALLAATSFDLDARGRPLRAAMLGGRVAPLGSGTALTLHYLRGRRLGDDRFRVALKARPPRRDGGHLWLLADISSRGVERARLRMRGVDLAAYEPVLASRGWLTKGARLGGDITFVRRGGDFALRGRLAGKGLVLRHPWIAAGAVGPFDGAIEARARLTSSGRLDIDRLALRSGGIELRVAGAASLRGHGVQVDLQARMLTLPCQRLLADLPRGFAPHLDGLAVSGNIGARLALRVDTSALSQTQVDLRLTPRGAKSCKVLVDAPGADVKRLAKGVTISVGGAHGRGQTLALVPTNPAYRAYRRIPRHVREAFVVAEDARFFQHDGFDPRQLKHAFVTNLRAGRPVRGASTISQQLVKNVFLHHARTLSRKFEEMVLTWRMEQVLSKRKILELYLNMVEMGPGLYGVQAAAQHYFGRDVRQLTPLHAAHLAALTPAPRPLSRRIARSGPDRRWMGKLRFLLHLMRRRGTITRGQQRRYAHRRLVLVSKR